MHPLPDFNFKFKKLSNWQWVTHNIRLFETLSRTHLYIAIVSVLIGLALALPLGVLAVRVRRTYGPILVFTTFVYALPSLAVFAFLLNYTGLSDWTLILPLAFYALAILVRSVTDGLNNVSEEMRVAATAMGYRPLRRLLTVELPAAVPVIIAGLRVATVASISLVTVGALIGIAGLGQLFTEGLANNFLTEIITGLVLVAFWAILFDLLLVLIGWLLAPWARSAS
jgi:osmoprotectant transport system permease protein